MRLVVAAAAAAILVAHCARHVSTATNPEESEQVPGSAVPEASSDVGASDSDVDASKEHPTTDSADAAQVTMSPGWDPLSAMDPSSAPVPTAPVATVPVKTDPADAAQVTVSPGWDPLSAMDPASAPAPTASVATVPVKTDPADAARVTVSPGWDPLSAMDPSSAPFPTAPVPTAPVKTDPADAAQATPDATRTATPDAATTDARADVKSDAGAADATSAADAGRCIHPTPATPPASVGPAANCPADPNPQAANNLPILHIVFPGALVDAAGGAAVDAELATSQAAMQRGLMYRKSMPANHGMLFAPKLRTNQEFWMHDVCIPLDMVFVDTDGFIVGIVEYAAPMSDAVDAVPCASEYILEVNGGWTRSHGVKAGQLMPIPAAAQ
jgi:uncharacterized membrane protein (UPF0127 family)